MVHKRLLGIVFALLVSIMGCDSGSLLGGSYDEGYDDGYDGATRASSNSDYIAGYEDGEHDADCDYWKKKDRKKFVKFCAP